MSEVAKAKIVVADDEESVRWTLKKALERSGYAVYTVSDGKAAVDTAERVSADLVLMDIKMPTLDGLEALSLMRDRHRIVGDHRGTMEIDDAEEGGCAVTMLLPLATQ